MLYGRDNRVIHHIHIPKCGGTSIRSLLKDNGWSVLEKSIPVHLQHEVGGFESTHHAHRNVWLSWKADPEFQFSVVRNPYDRFNSKMRQIFEERTRGVANNSGYDGMTLTPDVKSVEYSLIEDKVYYGKMNNHFRQQVDFIGPETSVFNLEDGLDSLLKELVDRDMVSPDSLVKKLNSKKSLEVKVPWSHPQYESLHQKFKDIYAMDFKLLGYETKQF